MDIAEIPIVDFLKYCKDGARNQGYYWIVCILSRASDSRGLYQTIIEDWQSLDSITGKRMLVLFAGNEKGHKKSRNTSEFCINDQRIEYIKRYNSFATVIGNSRELSVNLLSSERYKALQNHLVNIERTQTDAINSLREYFGIEEKFIPCLVYTPLHEGIIPVENIVVSIPNADVDLYNYFKKLFNEITPLVDALPHHIDYKLWKRINSTYSELLSHTKKSDQRDEILSCIQKRKYLSCEQPTRALLARYIDLCKEYKRKNGVDYHNELLPKPELLQSIENAFHYVDFPMTNPSSINAYISIGDNNEIKNSTIQVVLKKSQM